MNREDALNKIGELVVYARAQGWDEKFTEAFEALSAEPCEDAVSRAAAIKAMNDLEQEDIEQYGCSIPEGFDGKRAIEALQSLPSVIPNQEMGRWIVQDIHNCHTDFRCSECGYIHNFMHLYGKPNTDYTYCPNCGCRMV